MGGTRKAIILDCDDHKFSEILNENEVESISSYEGYDDIRLIIYWDYDEGDEDEQA